MSVPSPSLSSPVPGLPSPHDAESMYFRVDHVAHMLLVAADIRYGGRKCHNLRIPRFLGKAGRVNVPKQLRVISRRKDGLVTGLHLRTLCTDAGVPECYADVVQMMTTPSTSGASSPTGFAPSPKR
ncbi:MAG: hypothetical protein EOO41_01580 [Methanobacteriota archaeon]|nr:MAG: hypothetical protein EOO41_01580 [Euryarchaeota archaeon]